MELAPPLRNPGSADVITRKQACVVITLSVRETDFVCVFGV